MIGIYIWVVVTIHVGIAAGISLVPGEMVDRYEGGEVPISRLDIHDAFRDILQNGGDSNDVEERARNVHERLIAQRDTEQPITKATIQLRNMDDGNTFVPFSSYVDPDDDEITVRYEQQFDGHPVIGDDMVLTYDKNKNTKDAFGSAAELSNSENGDPCKAEKIVVLEDEAIKTALGEIGEANIDPKYLESRVAILDGKCVYEFHMFFQWHIVVSTETGKVLEKESMVHSNSFSISGKEYPLFDHVSDDELLIKSGLEVESLDNVLRQTSSASPGGNDKIGRHNYPDSKYGALRVTKNGTKCVLENDHVIVYDCANTKWGNTGCAANPQKPFEFDCPINTHKEINGAPSPLNDAFYYGDKTVQMFLDWIKIKPTCSANGGQCDKPVMYVHVGQNFENAFSFGRGLVFGDGETLFHPLSGAMDVMAHEFAHWFVSKNSGLIYSKQSGGLNEAFADMTGKAGDYYLFGKTSNWQLGGDIFKASGRALRYMDDPPKDGRSIGHARDYKDSMDVHYSSGVFNKAFYLLATKTGWNTKKAWIIMAKANLKFWSKSTSWDRAGDGVLDAACELDYNLDDVKSALAAVGIISKVTSAKCSTTPPNTNDVTLNLKTTTKKWGEEISWTLGTCASNKKYGSNKNYAQECKLAAGTYMLTCKDSYGDGWNGGYLEIKGKKYCHDFNCPSDTPNCRNQKEKFVPVVVVAPPIKFTKISGKWCPKNHGFAGTLAKAQAACKTDANCFGVYDTRCDNKGAFKLCNVKDKMVSNSRVGSCIYEKGQ